MPSESPVSLAKALPAARPRSLAGIWTDPRFLLWNLLTLAVSPLVLVHKAIRYFQGKRRYEFESIRWSARAENVAAYTSWKSTPGPRLVLAGVSFGEAVMMDALAKALKERVPDVSIAYCIRDPHSRRSLTRSRPELAVLPWPYEFAWPISRWLGRYDPDVLVFTQSFRNRPLAIAANRYGTSVALFAGKVRARSSGYYRLAQPLYRWLFGSFRTLMLVDQESCDAAKRFAGPGTQVVLSGDPKFDLTAPAFGAERQADLAAWLGDGPVIAAGSTESEAEDRMVLEAFWELRTKSVARLLVAPRKTERGSEVSALAKEFGFTAARRSQNDKGAEVMVLDTLGELAFAYCLCQAAYVGGAFDGEGHNVMEPLLHGVPVCYGMRRGHFEQMQKACEAAGLSKRVAGAEALADFWSEMLADSGRREEIRANAFVILERERGALDRTAEAILSLMS